MSNQIKHVNCVDEWRRLVNAMGICITMPRRTDGPMQAFRAGKLVASWDDEDGTGWVENSLEDVGFARRAPPAKKSNATLYSATDFSKWMHDAEKAGYLVSHSEGDRDSTAWGDDQKKGEFVDTFGGFLLK